MEEFSAHYDVLVVGAGPVGLAAALACAGTGRRVCLVGRSESGGSGRTVALLQGSLDLLEAIGMGPQVKTASAPLETMRLADITDSIFRPRPLAFRSEEIGLASFGRNIETPILVGLLLEAARACPRIRFIEGFAENYRFREDYVSALTPEAEIGARLLGAADGAGSPARMAARLPARVWRYGQTALTGIFAHEKPHRNASTEFHTRGGPFTLVPLPDDPVEGHRSSLVWMMRDEEANRMRNLPPRAFAFEAERLSMRLLGGMRLISDVGCAPMRGLRALRLTGRRVALLGEAAHVFPPIGAQGLNLGLRDAAALAKAIDGRYDAGDAEALASYARARRWDVALRTASVDLVNRSLPAAFPPIDLARGMALRMLAEVGPIRRAAMRLGLGPHARATEGRRA
jgi:2-octaprenyl-6-methoxyphenol hydroxylase